MERPLELSPIQEISDLDLSFLINQLSSASGDITERTIEEVLRDAEKIANSAIKSPQSNEVSLQSYTVDAKAGNSSGSALKETPTSTNVFMSAIVSLSEATNRIKNELATKDIEGSNSSSVSVSPPEITKVEHVTKLNRTNVDRSNTKNVARQRPILATLPKKNPSQRKESVNVQKTPRDNLISTGPDTKMARARGAVGKVYSRPWRTSSQKYVQQKQSTILSKVETTRRTDRSATSTISRGSLKKKQLPKRGIDDSSSYSDSKMSTSRGVSSHLMRHIDSSDSNSQTGSALRQLRDENARLNLQIKRLQAQIADKRPAPSLNRKPANNTSCKEGLATKAELAPKLDQFQQQLAAIQTKYESQLLTLTKKCEQLERERKPPAALPLEVLKSVENLPKFDMGCQTDKEKRDVSCQSYRCDGTTTEKPEMILLSPTKPNEDPKNSNSSNLRGVNFEFNDLDLDNNFVPWIQNADENVAEKSEKPSLSSKGNQIKKEHLIRPTVRGDQHLLTTIRGLQAEIQVKGREIRKLKNELATTKSRTNDKMRGLIRRTIGTQTIGLAASTSMAYDPNIFQAPAALSRENETLKEDMKRLRSDLNDLTEKRVLDLKQLQEKHEEEISTLLEQKLFLANKLDALLAKTFR